MKKLIKCLSVCMVTTFCLTACVDENYSFGDGVDFDDITIGTDQTVINAPIGTLTIDVSELIDLPVVPNEPITITNLKPIVDQEVNLGQDWMDGDIADKLSSSGTFIIKADVVNMPDGFPEFRVSVRFGSLLVFNKNKVTVAERNFNSAKFEAAKFDDIANSSAMFYSIEPINSDAEYTLNPNDKLKIKLSIEKTGTIKL